MGKSISIDAVLAPGMHKSSPWTTRMQPLELGCLGAGCDAKVTLLEWESLTMRTRKKNFTGSKVPLYDLKSAALLPV